MPDKHELEERFEGMSGAAQLRQLMPELVEWARTYRSHPAILAHLAERGVVVSLATFRKALYAYRRDAPSAAGRPGGEEGLRSPAEAVDVSAQAVGPPPDRLEQPVNEIPTTGKSAAQPVFKMSEVLDPSRRREVAAKYMNKYEEPRLGRKKAEQ